MFANYYFAPDINYYDKFNWSDFDDSEAYYRYKVEDYQTLLLKNYINGYDTNKTQNYCIYRAKEIIEDWVMVLGFDSEKIDFNALDGKFIINILEDIEGIPKKDAKKRKLTILNKLGFQWTKFRVDDKNIKIDDFLFESICKNIITNYDVTCVKDIFEGLGVNVGAGINWDLANRKYLATRYNTFIYCGGNLLKDPNTHEDKIVAAFGSINNAGKIRESFWKKRYPCESLIMDDIKLSTDVRAKIQHIFDDDDYLTVSGKKNVDNCCLVLMIYINRNEFLKDSLDYIKQDNLTSKGELQLIYDILDAFQGDSVKIIGKRKVELKKSYKKFIESVLLAEANNQGANCKDCNDLKKHLQGPLQALKKEWENPLTIAKLKDGSYTITAPDESKTKLKPFFVPDKEEYMVGFVYHFLRENLEWTDNSIWKENRSRLIYRLGQVAGVPYYPYEDDKKRLHDYVGKAINKYENSIKNFLKK